MSDTTASLHRPAPWSSGEEEALLAGFLAGDSSLTREAYAIAVEGGRLRIALRADSAADLRMVCDAETALRLLAGDGTTAQVAADGRATLEGNEAAQGKFDELIRLAVAARTRAAAS